MYHSEPIHYLYDNFFSRAKQWINACGRSDLLPNSHNLFRSHRLCDLHFEAKYISKGCDRKRLFANAIPTIFLKTFPAAEQSDPEKEAGQLNEKINIISGWCPYIYMYYKSV